MFVEKEKLDLGISKKDMPVIPITHPRFNDAKFTTLPNGDLEVKLAKYQEFYELTFTVSKSKAIEKYNYRSQEGYVPDKGRLSH